MFPYMRWIFMTSACVRYSKTDNHDTQKAKDIVYELP